MGSRDEQSRSKCKLSPLDNIEMPEKQAIRFENTTPDNFLEITRRDESSAFSFSNSTPKNFFVTFKPEDSSEARSSIGTLAADPTADANLERFENYGYTGSTPSVSRRASLPNAMHSATTKPVSSLSTGASLAKQFDSSLDPTFRKTLGLEKPSMFDQAFIHTRDLQYYNHYRAVIVCNIQVNSRFPSSALYNAMLALSALSMAHRERLDRVDSLQYYQLAVEGLRQYSTLESVNIIYTHYFLLLYEVAACERRANLELNHMTQLTRLLDWYFTTSTTNPSFVFRDQECQKCTEVSMACVPSNMLYCDMYNLIFQRQSFTIVPDVMVTGFFNAVHSNKDDPHIEAGFGDPEFSRKAIMLTVLSGWAHRVVRSTIEDVNRHDLTKLSDLGPRFQELEDKIKVMHDWCAQNGRRLPSNIYDEAYTEMPLQCQTTFDSAQFTIRWLLIYAHTSIFPQQRKRLSKRRGEYIQFLAREILYLTRPRWGQVRQIAASNLVAIFMCGTVVTSEEEKAEVLKLLEAIGAEASGRSFVRATDALKDLYKEQERIATLGEDERSVDWVVFLREKGLLDFSLFGI
ncbi:hypothetical protein BDZ45DRAFT_753147 [Acephala macrosclerotiorum]|nr:hypothetical protein BDZ45DRAFT_753147 [Acephala macrosclerotiorum]